MGYTSYSHDVTASYLASHKSSGTDPFVHTSSISSGHSKAECHELLDPKKLNKAGVKIRESLDSTEHPSTRAIAVLFDQTGSMGGVPRAFIEKLGGLMALLVKKGYVQGPQLMFGAIGDGSGNAEAAPCQIGQFESGNEMDSALTHIYLEGCGGGQKTESYELACWFLERFAKMDCLDKRGEKGYLFIIGDETPYACVKPEEVSNYLGEKIQAGILFSSRDPRKDAVEQAKETYGASGDLLSDLQKKFEVFWIMPGGGASYWNDSYVNDTLRSIFGQRFLKMSDPSSVCELIAATIGIEEGYDVSDIMRDLKDAGADSKSVANTCTALDSYIKTGAVRTVAKVKSGKLTKRGKDKVVRA